ncbi:MAG: pyridine nucleotide transhydrogenase [Bdellovibrio sp.]|nr:MAG: pyridine nucleotide transhydrogenase [Bdellovibrio sp.]
MSPTMIGIYVFVLSCFVGYHVIWGVTPALHTPLMAVTNAISAIVIVGAILVAGVNPDQLGLVGADGTGFGPPLAFQLLGFLAVSLAAINIFGGFVVSHRMLSMFKKKPKSVPSAPPQK